MKIGEELYMLMKKIKAFQQNCNEERLKYQEGNLTKQVPQKYLKLKKIGRKSVDNST